MQEKKRVCLRVAYDGTAYRGWQVQNNVRTIEGELNKALQEVTGEEIQVIGASRTDAGVHGLCNVAVFDTLSRIPGEKFSYALNQRLPEDIRIQKSEEVPADWHPRCPVIFIRDAAKAEKPMSTISLIRHFRIR